MEELLRNFKPSDRFDEEVVEILKKYYSDPKKYESEYIFDKDFSSIEINLIDCESIYVNNKLRCDYDNFYLPLKMLKERAIKEIYEDEKFKNILKYDPETKKNKNNYFKLSRISAPDLYKNIKFLNTKNVKKIRLVFDSYVCSNVEMSVYENENKSNEIKIYEIIPIVNLQFCDIDFYFEFNEIEDPIIFEAEPIYLHQDVRRFICCNPGNIVNKEGKKFSYHSGVYNKEIHKKEGIKIPVEINECNRKVYKLSTQIKELFKQYEISKHNEEIKELFPYDVLQYHKKQKLHEELITHFKYSPGGTGYYKAKEHFNGLLLQIDRFDNNHPNK